MPAVTLLVRSATVDDAEATAAIYNPEVVGSSFTFDLVPRTLSQQRDWLGQHAGAHPAVVAVDPDLDPTDHPGGIVGFGSLSPWRPRPAYLTSAEDSVYVHRDQRGRGIGRLLLAELVARGTAHGFHALFARVVGGHDVSIALHLACGFEVVGVEKEVGRKFGRWLDVVVMERLLQA